MFIKNIGAFDGSSEKARTSSNSSAVLTTIVCDAIFGLIREDQTLLRDWTAKRLFKRVLWMLNRNRMEDAFREYAQNLCSAYKSIEL